VVEIEQQSPCFVVVLLMLFVVDVFGGRASQVTRDARRVVAQRRSDGMNGIASLLHN